MKQVVATAVLGLMLFNPSLSFGQAQPKELPAIMVLNIRHEAAASPGLANILTNIVLQDLYDMKQFRVVGQRDVSQMLSTEQQKQLAGCTDTSCLVQIAGAMGTQFTLDGTVGVVGSSNVISLFLIDVTKATVVFRKTAVVKGENEQLLGIVHRLISELMEPVMVRERPVPPSPPPMGTAVQGREKPPLPAPPPPMQGTKTVERPTNLHKVWGHICFWSGLAIAGTGGAFTGMAYSTASDMEKGIDLNDDGSNRIKDFDAIAVTGYVTGGALMATGIMLWLLSPKERATAEARPMTIAPVIGSDGSVLMVSGVW